MLPPIGTWVQTVETRAIGKVVAHEDIQGEIYAKVVFSDAIIFALTDDIEGSLCEEDVGWYDPQDIFEIRSNDG